MAEGEIMEILEKTKELVALIKVAGNIDITKKILELEREIIALTRHNRQLQEKVEEQQKVLDLKGKMKWKKSVYWKESEEYPYCPVCWDGSHKLSHLEKSSRYAWVCQICNVGFG